MIIQENISLKHLHTFGIEVNARFYARFSDVRELKSLLKLENYKHLPILILGGGSNILFTKDFEGLVLHNAIKGISIVNENSTHAYIEAGAGEMWHDLVNYSIDQHLGGLENLSLIPGTVGASPMQNIGAYGVETKDVFYSLKALHIDTLEEHIFYNADCEFGYRESIFKKRLKGQYVIFAVTFILSKQPLLNISYGAIEETLKTMNINEPNIKDVSKAVCSIRQSKLPDPAKVGNAGSFFKNPEITLAYFEILKSKYPLLPSYPTKTGFTKVPAGWLIEQCGWKGKTIDNYGVHPNQALVLVNYGHAKGNDIYHLSEKIKESVFEKFKITLETEVNII